MENTNRVLVVDDEPWVALATQAVLKFCGYTADFVPGGEEALKCVTKAPGRFSLVMSDHSMPGFGGLELVNGLRAAGYRGGIIVVSAYLPADIRQAYDGAGVDEVMAKPFDVRTLRTTVEAVLRDRARAAA